MRLTVGPLPAAVYWRRRAVIAVPLALAVLVVVLATAHIGRHPAAPTRAGGVTGSVPSTGSAAPIATTAATTAGPDSPGPDPSTAPPPPDAGENLAPPVVATVPCADDEIRVTTEVSPSPSPYGASVTLTLIVRNTADHPCLRDVGPAQQELQVGQGGTVLWSSDHCDPPPGTPDVRAFGPNIETRFWRTWNPDKVAPHECDPPSGAPPAGAGTYQVVGRLGSKVGEPTSFDIRV